MSQLKGAEYLLDGYISLGQHKVVTKNNIQYTVQQYQGKHKNEFVLRSPTGDVFLYENNVLKQKWKENEKGVKSDEFIVYKNGRVDFRQRFEDILDQGDSKRIINHKKGNRMEIRSSKTGELMYHGKFNDNREKEGWGIEYDEESGDVVFEGMWRRGELIEVIRCFKGDVMTELKRNGSESLDPVKRIPMYVGGYRYDEDNEAFVREGVGCLIDEKTGIATRESEWKDGEEVCGRDLYDGWYNFTPLQLTIRNSQDMTNLSLSVTDLIIPSYSCNNLYELDLSKFKLLQSIEIGSNSLQTLLYFHISGLNRLKSIRIKDNSVGRYRNLSIYSNYKSLSLMNCESLELIEIGDDCFKIMNYFKIDGLNRLKTLTIGRNSFYNYVDDPYDSSGFSISNCESLESIQIGEFSFSDFAGEFELKNLPQLQSIQIGTIGYESSNFYWSSFVIRGIEMTSNIRMIRSSKSTIHYIG